MIHEGDYAMEQLKIYRKRMIPDECILLKDDMILERTDDTIVTKWNTLKPRRDFHHGYSCYFLKSGYKISKFYREDGSLLYWYCDIVDFDYHASDNTLIVTDLLADVVVYPDGFVKVVDLDELVAASDSGSISVETLKQSLIHLDKLLKIIYSGGFDQLKSYIELIENMSSDLLS